MTTAEVPLLEQDGNYEARKRQDTFRIARELGRLLLLDRKTNVKIDEILAEKLTKPGAFVVQVGAFDGEFDDPLRQYLKPGTVSGLLIEPQTKPFQALEYLYASIPNVTCVQAAVSESTEPIVLWAAELGNADRFGGAVAATNPKQVKQGLATHPGKHLLLGYRLLPEIVPGRQLSNIMEENSIEPFKIDVFVCDAEGTDPLIVHQLLNYGAEPKVIQYEHLHASTANVTDVNSRLLAEGYQLLETYKDTFAYK